MENTEGSSDKKDSRRKEAEKKVMPQFSVLKLHRICYARACRIYAPTVGFSGRLGESRLIADCKATMVRYPARYAEKERRGARSCYASISSLATHVLTASSTALDRSPFFPPNLSIVLNLSFFSSSSDSSTLIRPISTTNVLDTIRTCQMFFQ
jgi:hypothetical protein